MLRFIGRVLSSVLILRSVTIFPYQTTSTIVLKVDIFSKNYGTRNHVLAFLELVNLEAIILNFRKSLLDGRLRACLGIKYCFSLSFYFHFLPFDYHRRQLPAVEGQTQAEDNEVY